MREFSEAYLRRTRTGMWDDSRAALEPLALADRDRVLDVGCGTGELSRVLKTACPGTVVGCDADPELLAIAREFVPAVVGDARRLPFAPDSFEVVVCQALLINLADPASALREFARVSTDLVAAIEPDNGAVSLESTVETEPTLERQAREAYLRGVDTDVTLGSDAKTAFADATLDVVETRRYDHERTIAPPYDDQALTVARRKATGAGLADDRATMQAGGLGDREYDELRSEWRRMGREVVSQMRDRAYRRTETVPFYVTIGRVP